jgi:DNA-binding MarR family transcriptional regulator
LSAPGKDNLLLNSDRAWQALTGVQSAVLHQVKSDLAPITTLTIGEIEVLEQLLNGRGGVRMADLADSVHTSRRGFTRRLDRLEHSGLAERTAASDDGRGARATLTSTGEDLARSVVPLYRESIARHFTDRLGRHEDCVVTALEGILEA